MFSVGNPATLSCFNLPNLTFTDMQNCKSQHDTKGVVFTKFASPASVWMLLPSTMTLQNWDQSLQSFLTDQAWEQNADDGAGVNRAECRPPLPSSIAPGAAVITAPNSRQRHRRRHKWFKFRDKKRDYSSRLLWKIVSCNQQVLYEETHQLSLTLLLSKKGKHKYFWWLSTFACKKGLNLFKPDLYPPVCENQSSPVCTMVLNNPEILGVLVW